MSGKQSGRRTWHRPKSIQRSDNQSSFCLLPATVSCHMSPLRIPCPRYTGFTVELSRSPQQHNDLVRYGSAYPTRRHWPRANDAVIHGLTSKTQELQFERVWQHLKRSLILKTHKHRTKALPSRERGATRYHCHYICRPRSHRCDEIRRAGCRVRSIGSVCVNTSSRHTGTPSSPSTPLLLTGATTVSNIT